MRKTWLSGMSPVAAAFASGWRAFADVVGEPLADVAGVETVVEGAAPVAGALVLPEPPQPASARAAPSGPIRARRRRLRMRRCCRRVPEQRLNGAERPTGAPSLTEVPDGVTPDHEQEAECHRRSHCAPRCFQDRLDHCEPTRTYCPGRQSGR